nr:hypothetical protein [Tanacetum cinerariifolium]
MVAYLSKSDASEGFNQIIDFLNGSSIKYALTVNPNIYVSCIKQFWTIVAVKKVNDVIRLQALVDKKKVVVTKATIREALCLDDAESVECLPNEEIFAEKQVGDLSTYATKYTSPALTQKVFGNKRRVGKVFSRVETPLFTGMLVAHEVAKEGNAEVLVMLKEMRQAESQAEIYKIDLDHANKVLSMQEDETKPAEVQEVVDIVTTAKIITEVVTAASETITAASTNITATEAQVPAATLTATSARVTAAPSRRRKGIVIRDLQEESTTSTIIPVETKSKDKGKGILVEEPKPLKKQAQIKQDEQYARELEEELNKTMDWDEVIDHVKRKAKEDLAVKRYQVLKRKPQTEVQARKNMMVYLKNVAGFKMDYFKGMSYDDIRPIFEMLNAVRLEVEEESEVSLEFLSFGVDAAKEFKKNMLSV